MLIINRSEAKQTISDNFELACRHHMAVITVFHKDQLTNEIYATDMFSHDAVEAMQWKNNYLKDLNRLEVPYICYVGNCFECASGYIQFEE